MSICPCGYTGKRTFYEHLFYDHGYTKQQIENIKREKRLGKLNNGDNYVRTCKHCGEMFSSSFSINKHIKDVHPENYVDLSTARVWCPVCEERLKNHRELVQHAQNSHADSPDQYSIKIIKFPNMEQYKKWRRITEGNEITRHAVVSSKRTSAGLVKYLRCSRASLNGRGKYRVMRNTKKVVPFCTAFMKVTEKETAVEVEYCSNHLGHTAEPEVLSLDKDLEKYIASLLKKGYSCRAVHKIANKEAAYRTVMRRVTPKKIWLIAKKYALRPVDLQRKLEIRGSTEVDEEEEHYDFMDTLEDVVMTSETVVEESTRESNSCASESQNTPNASCKDIAEPEIQLSDGKSALDLLGPEPAQISLDSSVDGDAEDNEFAETKVEMNVEKSALDLLGVDSAHVLLEQEPCESKQSNSAEDWLNSKPAPSLFRKEPLQSADEATERKQSDEVVLKSETSNKDTDVVSMEQTTDYKLANMEVLGRIEKIIMGFHTDVIQISSQSDHSSYKTLNKALRAMEAARALTQSTASKISKEPDSSS